MTIPFRLCILPPDLRAEQRKVTLDALVSAVNVFQICHAAATLRAQSGNHQRRSAAKIRGLDGCAVERCAPRHNRHVDELARMGAEIRVAGRVAVVTGRAALNGASVKSTDLRGGAALVIAALGAQGLSRVGNIEHIDRGYESIERDLSLLGAEIRREDT